MVAKLSAVQSRSCNQAFVEQCGLPGLLERLPLRWPTPGGTPPSPKKRYRSHYCYLGYDDLLDAKTWEHLSDFEVALRLVDFEGLRPVLAQRLGWTSARGYIPFDPVSLFLLQGWQITNGWSRAHTLTQLRHPRYADLATLFGFENDLFPTEGGMRHFLSQLGRHSETGEAIQLEVAGKTVDIALQALNELIAQSVDLIRQADLLSPQAWEQALICPDGMIHDAASRQGCGFVQESCYQPTSPDAPRPCPAMEKDKQGCACDTAPCAQMCRFTTPRDHEARFILYQASNQPQDSPHLTTDGTAKKGKKGKPRYGYRSLPLQLSDPERRFSIVLLDDFRPANEREENPSAALLLQLETFYPDLNLDAVAGDAGLGYDIFLSTVYQLGAKRVVDLRSHQTDRDKAGWTLRGYDNKGRPLCPFGYSFTTNGFDPQRQRRKWCCNQACLKDAQPLVSLEAVSYPPLECPFQSPDRPHGKIINVAQRFSDGSSRLVRDIPVGTPAWKRLYHRARNAVEGRNAVLEHWGLKRLPVFGTSRGKALVFQADVWLNLTTLARLVRQATLTALPG